MQYVGIQRQIRRNNLNSTLLLVAFPLVLLAMVYAFLWLANPPQNGYPAVSVNFTRTIPFVIAGTFIWFTVAWFSHSMMIRKATGSSPLERKENKRVYNLVENLCIARGMKIPKIFVIEDSSLNAFASGISEDTYAISLSRGIIDKLDDHELEAVIAHEMTHISNRDVRLLIISVIFVGIFAFLSEMTLRSIQYRGWTRNGKNNGAIMLAALIITAVAYLISLLLRFGISRSREYMADAGAAELTRNPHALASALRKISNDPWIEAVKNRDVAQMFIDNPKPGTGKLSRSNLFATHPPIGKRIALLEQFV